MTVLTITRSDVEYLDLTFTGVTAEQLTGQPVTFTAKHSPADTEAVFVKTTADGVTVDAEALTAEVKIDPADTASLDARRVRLVFDVQADLSDGPHTVASGQLIVEPDVSA